MRMKFLTTIGAVFFLVVPIHAFATTVYLTSGTSWTVPNGVTTLSTVDCIGGGANGVAGADGQYASGSSGAGGGGGGFSRKNNLTVTPGSSISYAIGAAGTNGGDTSFNSGSCLAKGASGLTGGQAASGTGDTKVSGGNGGAGASGGGLYGNSGGGGGGAGGPTGSSGSPAAGASGGAGTTANGASGGAGGKGDGTAGGAGGAGGSPGVLFSGTGGGGVGGTGSSGTEYAATPYGAGGGGGGGGKPNDYAYAANGNGYGGAGGAGGLYGSGGGGGGGGGLCGDDPCGVSAGGAGGAGKQGLIVITYSLPSASRDLTVNDSVSVSGNVTVTANLSKGSGTFLIDHPTDPANKLLYHSFVESSDALNEYTGTAIVGKNGDVTIRLPDYFGALNGDPQYFIRALDMPMPNLFVKQEVKDNAFVVGGGSPGGEISWMVTGVRHDPYILANPIVPEVDKGSGQLVDKGQYLFDESASGCSTIAGCVWGFLMSLF